MSDFTTAFDELYAAQNDAMGTTPVCAIGAITGVDCVISDNGTDAAFFGGGIANTSEMTLQTKLSDWSTLPVKNDAITVSGLATSNVSRSVISTTERNGILYIQIGDPSL